jgi:uncharacterized damage-inducible protein DinB
MKSMLVILFLIMTINNNISAQEDKSLKKDTDLPYYQIPDYPDSYTPENVAARIIDGLGYRYYWATEGLTENDLDFRPSEEARTTNETLDHIYGLSLTIVKASLNQANMSPREEMELTFEQKRRKTLENFEKASKVLKNQDANTLGNNKVIFKNNNGTTEFPYWNMLNGPISDAIYHTGQVVSFRRSSGNPINPNVRVFSGKTSE